MRFKGVLEGLEGLKVCEIQRVLEGLKVCEIQRVLEDLEGL